VIVTDVFLSLAINVSQAAGSLRGNANLGPH
jgi:hypothetical protein